MDFRHLALGAITSVCVAISAAADGTPEAARLDPEQSRIEDFGSNLHVELALSRPVPWRVFTLDEPRRLVLDFAAVEFSGVAIRNIIQSDAVSAWQRGRFRDGWSRLVLQLVEPMRIETAGLSTQGPGAILKLQLAPTTDSDFAARSGVPESADFGAEARDEQLAMVAGAIDAAETTGEAAERSLRVTIDPGHGGFDPGAEAGGMTEAEAMLAVARALGSELSHAGMEVTLTREADHFVPLPRRRGIAREARADLFLSLHADAPPAGHVDGATIYTLSSKSAEATAGTAPVRAGPPDPARRPDGTARRDATARSERLAEEIAAGLSRATGAASERPQTAAEAPVPDAAGYPSVLIALGDLSDASDRARLDDPVWRARIVSGIRAGIERWADGDAEKARKLLQ